MGGAVGLGFSAVTGSPALETTRNGALILGGVVSVLASWMLPDEGGQGPDAHDVTLAWHAYANGEWPQVRMPGAWL